MKIKFSGILVLFIHIISLVWICWGTAACASEIDSYTKTRLIRKDAVAFINHEINRLINASVREANERGLSDAEDLYRILNKNLGGRIISQLEKNLEQHNDEQILKIDIRESIYNGMGFLQAPSLILSRKMGGVFKADDFIIGTDKLGHFIAQGFTYFKTCYLKNYGVEDALLYGINSEMTYYGFTTTGIFSYGDLVANFQGMRFWNDLLGEFPDILNEDHPPYIQRKGDQWVVAFPVDMRRYFDAAWDERINRNVFSDPELEDCIGSRINQAKGSARFPDPEKAKQTLELLNKKYKAYSAYLLNLDNFSRHRIKYMKSLLKTSIQVSRHKKTWSSGTHTALILLGMEDYL